MTNSPPLQRYRAMLVMRQFEEACLRGSRSREIHGELHLGIGQEAVAAGMVGTLRLDDAVVSTHRNHCHGIAKGVDLEAFMAEIFERETGLCRGRGGHMHPFDLDTHFSATGIVGSALPVALGYAYAHWLEGTDSIAVGVTGEGGANAGAFHECLNMAAAWKLPLVVLVENNGWAISVPAEHVMPEVDIAARASAYGAWGKKVDGVDVEVVAEAFAEAAAHARSGRGPAISGSYVLPVSRPLRRRSRQLPKPRESQGHAGREGSDPLARQRLINEGGVDEGALRSLETEVRESVQDIHARVLAAPRPDASGAARFLYVEDAT